MNKKLSKILSLGIVIATVSATAVSCGKPKETTDTSEETTIESSTEEVETEKVVELKNNYKKFWYESFEYGIAKRTQELAGEIVGETPEGLVVYLDAEKDLKYVISGGQRVILFRGEEYPSDLAFLRKSDGTLIYRVPMEEAKDLTVEEFNESFETLTGNEWSETLGDNFDTVFVNGTKIDGLEVKDGRVDLSKVLYKLNTLSFVQDFDKRDGELYTAKGMIKFSIDGDTGTIDGETFVLDIEDDKITLKSLGQFMGVGFDANGNKLSIVTDIKNVVKELQLREIKSSDEVYKLQKEVVVNPNLSPEDLINIIEQAMRGE